MDYLVLAGCGLTRLDAAKVLPLVLQCAREDVSGPLICYRLMGRFSWPCSCELPLFSATQAESVTAC